LRAGAAARHWSAYSTAIGPFWKNQKRNRRKEGQSPKVSEGGEEGMRIEFSFYFFRFFPSSAKRVHYIPFYLLFSPYHFPFVIFPSFFRLLFLKYM
jgi:hypothetical protein